MSFLLLENKVIQCLVALSTLYAFTKISRNLWDEYCFIPTDSCELLNNKKVSLNIT